MSDLLGWCSAGQHAPTCPQQITFSQSGRTKTCACHCHTKETK